MKFLISWLLLVVGLWGQAITTSSITLTAPPPPPVRSLSTSIVGNSGNATYYYWVVANYTGGKSVVSPSAIVINAPNTLSVSNYVRVNWNAQAGASTYDVLRTTTANVPNGNCNCAVTTATSATTVSDTGSALSSYTVTSVGGANTTCIIDNLTVASPEVSCEPIAWAGGTGTVSTVSVTSANGFAGSVTTPTTAPAITLNTTVTGVLKGNGTAISAATACTDYAYPVTSTISTSGPVADPGGCYTLQFNNASGALTFNAPVGVAGYQRCYRNATTRSGIITIQMAASNTVDVDGANGTSAGTLVSGGALGDAVCIVSDTTNHWYAYISKGTWTNN